MNNTVKVFAPDFFGWIQTRCVHGNYHDSNRNFKADKYKMLLEN